MSNTLRAKLYRYGVIGGVVASGLLAKFAGAQTDPFDLQGKINTVASTTGSYFAIMITSFWPFALGGVIVLGVVGFGWFIIQKFFHH